MDRNNIAFGFFGMQKDLQHGATASGIGGGIFFFGYLFLQVPGSLLAERWSAKALHHRPGAELTQLLIVGFVLGFVEVGVSLPP